MATDSIAVSKKAEATNFRQGAVVALGRFLFAVIFVMAGTNHFSKQTIGYAASQGVPMASIAFHFPVCWRSWAIVQNLGHGSSCCSWFQSR